MRAGLLRDWFELRIAYNSGSLNDETINIDGSQDLYIGAKIGLTPQRGLLPAPLGEGNGTVMLAG